MQMVRIEEWSLPHARSEIAEMRRRLMQTRFPSSTYSGWNGGIDIGFLRRFTEFLAEEYSWETDSRRFGGHHLMAYVPADDASGELAVHVNLPFGVVADAQPLAILHGWPSSSFEFVHVVEHLRGKPVFPILVDLPGFGFSGPTPKPTGPRSIATVLSNVFADGLGLRDIVVHGNDWGSTVACWLAIDHPKLLRGIHLSMMGLRPMFGQETPRPSHAETVWINTVQKRLAADAGYREIQSTKPNTAVVGLVDSPAALAAWLVEKFHTWSGGESSAEPPVAVADLAALVTGYWLSGNIASANWIYAAARAHDDTLAPAGATGDLPVSFSLFGNGFFPPPPESWARRIHNVVDYTVHESGGHFPALTRPVALANDLQRFCAAF